MTVPDHTTRPLWRMVRRTGLRGLFLLVLGVFDVLYGLTIAWPTPDQQRSTRYPIITHLVPGLGAHVSLWVWAVLWWAVAVACFVYAWRAVDTPGYACAVGLKVAWAIVNLLGFLRGLPDGAGQTLTWLAFAAAVAIMSRMAEPIRTDGTP